MSGSVPPLRCGRFVRAFRETLGQCAQRRGFRVVHYSIQDDHAHFLVEAQGEVCRADGMKSLAARFARCVNRLFGRVGRVLADRFHHVVTPSCDEAGGDKLLPTFHDPEYTVGFDGIVLIYLMP